jgi:L-rhamnose-H+ transport protein
MFFYGMGESIVGQVAGWSMLMTASIVFSNMWGILSKEWSGVKRRTMQVLAAGLIILILSTIVFGFGKALKIKEDKQVVKQEVPE